MDYDSLSDEELIKAYQAKVGNIPDYDSMSDEELLAEFAKTQGNKEASWGDTPIGSSRLSLMEGS